MRAGPVIASETLLTVLYTHQCIDLSCLAVEACGVGLTAVKHRLFLATGNSAVFTFGYKLNKIQLRASQFEGSLNTGIYFFQTPVISFICGAT